MNLKDQSVVHAIRKFNRFYTNILGLLDKHMLDSAFSLSEIRVLYEIGNMDKCTAKKITEKLKMDSGYLSRVIKQFERRKLIYRIQSDDDRRWYFLYLTSEGENLLSDLQKQSDKHINQMIGSLTNNRKKKLLESMNTIEDCLAEKPNQKVNIRYDLTPGDIGYLIYLHGWIYAEECGYNHVFEGYVCKTFYDFLEKYSPEKDRIWFAEINGEMIGSIAIVSHSDIKAQLRWFIIHPSFRGTGLGRDLFDKAINYCYDRKFQKVFLDTTQDQQTAIKMYRKQGFKKVSQVKNEAWGRVLTEEIYELTLER